MFGIPPVVIALGVLLILVSVVIDLLKGEERAVLMTAQNHDDLNDPYERAKLLQPAPHETGGVMRMFRAGYKSSAIAEKLKIGEREIQDSIKQALDAEGEAARKGLEIKGEILPKGTT